MLCYIYVYDYVICCIIYVYDHVICNAIYSTLVSSVILSPGPSCDAKLQVAGLASYGLSRGNPPFKLAVYIPGTKVAW